MANSLWMARFVRSKVCCGATVTSSFAMLDMEMPNLAYRLAEQSPGRYKRAANALVMVGRWGLTFEVEPPHDLPFTVTIIDHAVG